MKLDAARVDLVGSHLSLHSAHCRLVVTSFDSHRLLVLLTIDRFLQLCHSLCISQETRGRTPLVTVSLLSCLSIIVEV